MSSTEPQTVVVHPLVLLSVVDHYHRVAKDTKKRVVGVILGESHKGTIEATNSFAVPFEEDERDPSIWFLDHNYIENMFRMFKKVNARERIVGWYHTGPRLREADPDVHRVLEGFCADPLLVICEVKPREMGLPVHAYVLREEARADGSERARKVFSNLSTEVGATEAEEIGVEHLLRDVKDATASTLSSRVGGMVTGLRGLRSRLTEIRDYLSLVLADRLPTNHDVLANLQNALSLLPDLSRDGLARALAGEVNDSLALVYLGSLLRSVLALHSLIENKEARAAHEQAAAKGAAGKVAGKDAAKDAGKGAGKDAAKEAGKGEEASKGKENAGAK